MAAEMAGSNAGDWARETGRGWGVIEDMGVEYTTGE
jgi:hypothetical protein